LIYLSEHNHPRPYTCIHILEVGIEAWGPKGEGRNVKVTINQRTIRQRSRPNVRRRTFANVRARSFFRSHSNDRMTIVRWSCDDRDRSDINVIWTFYDRSCFGCV